MCCHFCLLCLSVVWCPELCRFAGVTLRWLMDGHLSLTGVISLQWEKSGDSASRLCASVQSVIFQPVFSEDFAFVAPLIGVFRDSGHQPGAVCTTQFTFAFFVLSLCCFRG